jgi:hypothetical protein
MTQAAIEAAIDDERHRRPRLTGKRAVATGAALALAARVAIKRGPGLPDVVGLMHVPEHLRERLADRWMPEADRGDEEPDEGPEAEVAEDEYDDEDELPEEDDEAPEAEADEDEHDDEDRDEAPEAEADEDDYDDEDEPPAEEDDQAPEAQADEDDYDDEAPDSQADEGEDESPDEGGDPESLEDDEAGISNGAPSDRDTPGLLEVLGARRSRPPATSRRRRSRVRVDPVARPPEPPERASSADE